MLVTSLQLWAEQKLNVKQKTICFTSFHITDWHCLPQIHTENLVALKCKKQELKEGSTQPTDPRFKKNKKK